MTTMQKAFLKFLIFCGVLFGLFALVLSCRGADINAGYSWTPTDRVTSAKLNSVISGATINTTFLSDRTAVQPVAGDTFLLYQATSQLFRKSTFGTMFLNNTNMIVGQAEDTLPVGGDSILTYDLSANALKRSQLDSAVFTNTALINTRSNWTAPGQDATFYLSCDAGIYTKQSRSNLFYNYANFTAFTNVAQQTILNGADEFMIFCPLWGSNRMTTLGGLVTNSVNAVAANQTGDFLWGYKASNTVPTKFTTGWLSTNIGQRFASGYYNVLAAGAIANVAHGLTGTPISVRWVLVCTNTAGDATSGYAYGDEIDLRSLTTSGFLVTSSFGANATNVFAISAVGATWQLISKSSGSATAPSNRTNFAAMCYAYLP